MTTADQRLWRTREGDRLVVDGDPAAAFLAYAPGDEIAKADVSRLPKADAEAKAEPEPKAKATPANKARTRAADK